MTHTIAIICFVLLLAIPIPFQAQTDEKIVRILAFYNVENLFDTINHPDKLDDDFTPEGKNRFRSSDYQSKLLQTAKVISKIGGNGGPGGPDLLGLAEVENKNVIIDLISCEALSKHRYGIIHFESPDIRGIDVALLYKKDVFTPVHQSIFEVKIWKESGERIHTRYILRVSGVLDGELLHLLVNHWPSRRGGRMRSEPKRMKAAFVVQNILDEIRIEDPDPKVIIMGDFNDDPINKSIAKGLLDPKKADSLRVELFNPMRKLFKKGINSLAYRDNLNLFDQIILSKSLHTTQTDSKHFRFLQATIYNPSFLSYQKGKYRGYPKRSFENNKYTGGFSDHYPVYVSLVKNH